MLILTHVILAQISEHTCAGSADCVDMTGTWDCMTDYGLRQEKVQVTFTQNGCGGNLTNSDNSNVIPFTIRGSNLTVSETTPGGQVCSTCDPYLYHVKRETSKLTLDFSGGSVVLKCTKSPEECNTNSDCPNSKPVCRNNYCILPTCEDGFQNQDEENVDCGGPNCNSCGCGGDDDCSYGQQCFNGTCFSSTGYFLSDFNGLCSDLGATNIDTLNECRDSVLKIKYLAPKASFSAYPENSRYWPKGCYIAMNTQKVIWNKHNLGRPRTSARQVCVRSGT